MIPLQDRIAQVRGPLAIHRGLDEYVPKLRPLVRDGDKRVCQGLKSRFLDEVRRAPERVHLLIGNGHPGSVGVSHDDQFEKRVGDLTGCGIRPEAHQRMQHVLREQPPELRP
jgi:hypothetical protein